VVGDRGCVPGFAGSAITAASVAGTDQTLANTYLLVLGTAGSPMTTTWAGLATDQYALISALCVTSGTCCTTNNCNSANKIINTNKILLFVSFLIAKIAL